ncbi:ribonuclease D [Nocardioides mangrovicus]|uniref:Ribonuclease D n=1 Tax=Nocardioides mangrovicus TaxID=2478913 RepID=A0A3L8P2J1_9ACTN|nr:HRDC domain-containing protein [Nocardioides mangrovicus]RLV49182.1 ribonuclease D [Nocardioides mangrovicus]
MTSQSDQPAPDQPAPDSPASPEDTEPELELLTLRDGLPEVVETDAALAAAVADLAGGHGPVALDAERASGYKYSARAYLVQLRRAGATTWLIDPIAFEDLTPLRAVLAENEWVLHAANQDLPCLREVGLEPPVLFDTELAARLLGYPRVGLAALVEAICEKRVRKEHSAADWSQRPLPEAWLDYAALDVEVLLEIRDRLAAELVEAGKDEWARQEFEHVMRQRPSPRVDPWRRTSGMHKVRGKRPVAAVRELWLARDEIARLRDVTPGRIIPDSAIVVAASTLVADRPVERRALLGTRGFHGRGAGRYADVWVAAMEAARTMPEADLPPVALRSDGPPPPRAWADRDPEAAARLTTARAALAAISEERSVPVENMMTPDLVRRVLWQPPPSREPVELTAQLAQRLAEADARPWQIELVGPVLAEAIIDPVTPDAGTPEPTTES